MTPCIIFPGAKDRDGYGIKWRKGRKTSAHRAAWEDANGPVPDGLDVLHKCDNRACWNAEHLFLGTKGDNNRDRAAKGRSATGEKNGRAKLTPAQANEIRSLLRHGLSMHAIGRRFGIDWTTVRSLRDGETWTRSGSVHESPVGEADAPGPSPSINSSSDQP